MEAKEETQRFEPRRALFSTLCGDFFEFVQSTNLTSKRRHKKRVSSLDPQNRQSGCASSVESKRNFYAAAETDPVLRSPLEHRCLHMLQIHTEHAQERGCHLRKDRQIFYMPSAADPRKTVHLRLKTNKNRTDKQLCSGERTS